MREGEVGTLPSSAMNGYSVCLSLRASKGVACLVLSGMHFCEV